MYKSCPRCGRVHDFNYKCGEGKTPRKFVKDEESKLRSRYSWQKKREEIRDRAYFLCEVCKDRGDYTPKKVEVHHIRKLKEDHDGLLENDNLITLCSVHHREADRGQLNTAYLLELVKKREAER